MSHTPRFVVADPGLTGPEGHHLHYSEGVAEAAQALGMTAVVLAGKAFTGTIAEGRIACEPCFTARYQTSGGGGWPRQALFSAASLLPSGLAASVAPPIRRLRRHFRRGGTPDDPFGPELAARLHGPEDIVLLHSVSAANVAALTAVPPRFGHLLIVLRRTPEEMDIDDPGPEPIAVLLRALADRHGAKITLYADTEPLARLFREATGLPVHAVPPPVSVPVSAAPRSPGNPPHFVFIGGARLEKNYHLLPAIVAACRGRASFTLQAGVVDAASDPLVQRAHRTLRAMAGPDLRLVEQPLHPPEYWALLGSADLVLVPYDSAAYGPRSSGILVEALALGIPALVPAGCWMEHAGGAHRTVAMRDAEDAPDAALRALTSLPELFGAAQEGRGAWREAHGPGALLAALLAPLPMSDCIIIRQPG